jgi:hypothetical protein
MANIEPAGYDRTTGLFRVVASGDTLVNSSGSNLIPAPSSASMQNVRGYFGGGQGLSSGSGTVTSISGLNGNCFLIATGYVTNSSGSSISVSLSLTGSLSSTTNNISLPANSSLPFAVCDLCFSSSAGLNYNVSAGVTIFGSLFAVWWS